MGRHVAAGMGGVYLTFGGYHHHAALKLAGIFGELWDKRVQAVLRWVAVMTVVLAAAAIAWLASTGGGTGTVAPENEGIVLLAELTMFYGLIGWAVLFGIWLSRRNSRTAELGRWMTIAMWAAADEDLRQREWATRRRPLPVAPPVPIRSLAPSAAVSSKPEIPQPLLPALASLRRPVTPVSTGVRRAEPRREVRPVDRPREDGIFHVRFLTGLGGRSITSEFREEWLRARRTGVTATDCNKIVLKSGRPSTQRSALLEAKIYGEPPLNLAAFAHGIAREPVIAEWVWEEYGIVHNQAICTGTTRRHLATPDGIGDGVIAEIKTSGKPLDAAARTYSDQLQWQLHVTGSEQVLFVVENRETLKRETRWVERDEERIAMLAKHADLFLDELDGLAGDRER